MRMGSGRATAQQGGTQEVGQGFNQLKQGVKEGAEKVHRLPHVFKTALAAAMRQTATWASARCALTGFEHVLHCCAQHQEAVNS